MEDSLTDSTELVWRAVDDRQLQCPWYGKFRFFYSVLDDGINVGVVIEFCTADVEILLAHSYY